MRCFKVEFQSRGLKRWSFLLMCILLIMLICSLIKPVIAVADNNLIVKAVGDTYLKVSPEGTVTLTVDASCDSGELSYQWRASKDLYYLRFSSTEIAGATAASYTTETLKEQTYYRCVVTDINGNTGYVDFDVRIENHLTVNGLRGGWIQQHYLIQPDESVDLTVDASCDVGALTYKWEGYIYNIDNRSHDFFDLPDAKDKTYTTPPLNCIAFYRCIVADSYGNSLDAYYYINIDSGFEAVGFSMAEKDEFGRILVPLGETLTLEVAALSREGNIIYRWSDRNGEIDGATEATYVTEPITKQTYYNCDVMDSFGNRQYLYFEVAVDNKLTAKIITDEEIEVQSGESASFAVEATTQNGDVHYIWKVWSDDSSMESQTSDKNTFTLENIVKSTEVWCEVYDDYDNVEVCSFYVTVIDEDGLEVETVSPFFQVAGIGETVTLKAKINGGNGELTYKWYDWNDDVYSGTDALQVSLASRWNMYTLNVSDNNNNSDYVDFIVVAKSSVRSLKSGEQIRVNLNSPDYVVYSFIPDTTGDYTLKFLDSNGCNVAVFDKKGELQGAPVDYNYVYSLTTARLTAGQEYYYLIQTAGDNGGGSHIMTLTSNVVNSDGGTLQLPVGQTIRFPGNVKSVTSNSSSVVSVAGTIATVKKAGTATVTVMYENSSQLIYTIKGIKANVLKLPAALTTIEREAFAGDEKIEYVELGSSVQRVDSYAFNNAKNLKVIVIDSVSTRLMPGAFSGTLPLIICPEGSSAETFAEANGLSYLYVR